MIKINNLMSEDQTKSPLSSTMVRCPYVRKHKIQPRNFPAHIQKCQKSLPQSILSKFATCKYNSFHIFSAFDIAAHQLNCPDKRKMELLQQSLTQISNDVILEESSKQTQCVNQNMVKECPVEKNDLVKVRFSIYQNDPSIQEITSENKPVLLKEVKNQININSISSSQSSSEQSDSQDSKIQEYKKLKKKQKNRAQQEQKSNNFSKPHQKLQLYQCSQCSYALHNPEAKLWRNKKIVKYLKAYKKLQQEHDQILKYIEVVSHLFPKGKTTLSKAHQNKCVSSENKKVSQTNLNKGGLKTSSTDDQNKKIGKNRSPYKLEM